MLFTYQTAQRSLLAGDCRCASLAATEDTLFLCGGSDGQRQLKRAALDLRTGQEKWRHDKPGSCGPLLVANSLLYQWDGHTLRAFDRDGQAVWASTEFHGLPTIVGDRLYLSLKQPLSLVILQAKSWRQLARFPIPELPAHSPLISQGNAYYGTHSGRIVRVHLRTGHVQVSHPARRILSPLVSQGQRLIFSAQRATGFALMALDLQTDTVSWAVPSPVLSQARPLIVGARVFWGADRLYAIEAERGRFQTYEMSGGPVGTPLLSQNTLYVPGGRFIHAVDPRTGQIRERFGAEEWIQVPPTVGSPLMHQDVVYFSSLDCRVYAVRFENLPP